MVYGKCKLGGGGSDLDLDLDTEFIDKFPALHATWKDVAVPAMPTVDKVQGHRCKDQNDLHSPFTHLTALVSRPVPKKEMKDSPEAMAACKKGMDEITK